MTAWVIGQREVVSFQGDGGTVKAISRYTTTASLTLTEAAIPTRLSYVCQQCARYVTAPSWRARASRPTMPFLFAAATLRA